MKIQSYQVHNVLNVYRRQLSQGKSDQSSYGVTQNTHVDTLNISTQAKNQSIMDKVTANVLKKITNVDLPLDFNQELIRQQQPAAEDPYDSRKEQTFTFNTIADNNRKETRSIVVDNSQVLMNRLDELAKAAIDRKAG